jgi:opacity protein-like surface antigen
MKIKLACLGLLALLAAAGTAQAGDFSFGAGLKERDVMPMPAYGLGMRDRVEVPAPIPVPAPAPVPEGFTYYLRADLGWSFEPNASFSGSGLAFGNTPLSYSNLTTSTSTDGVLGGTFGIGAYFTPRFRGDLTLDFRGHQDVQATSTYTDIGPPLTGLVSDRLRVNRVIGLANVYWDLMQRGVFTPYVGAGIGFTYNDIQHNHVTSEDTGGGFVVIRTGVGKETNLGLAGALMAGASISLGHQWVIDVNYRALYLEGGSVSTAMSTTEVGRATLDNLWEHQVRVGLRFNIW